MAYLEEYGQMGQIFSVSSLTELIRSELEKSFPFVWVRGEVTDYSISSSGHMYFALKDANSLLQCVWFAGQRKRFAAQSFDPLTGEVFDEPRPDMDHLLRDGLELICAGSINLYAKSGRYQLIVEHAELSGQGALALALEQRKAKYAAAGYFALERKRPLPVNPVRLALITSPNGAAIHDFLKISASRGLSTTIRLFPVTVQGKGAAMKMAQAIEEANSQDWAELVVLIRGGGSAEDLMEFNEPVLVEAIHDSILPVLAGIGHEVDVFLSDLTADVRAATPSHAAQILWPLRSDIWQKLDDLDLMLDRRTSAYIDRLEDALAQKSQALGWLSPQLKIQRLLDSLKQLDLSLQGRMKNLLADKFNLLSHTELKIGEPVALLNRLRLSEEKLKWQNASTLQLIHNIFRFASEKLLLNSRLLNENMQDFLGDKMNGLEKLEIMLKNLNPFLPLERGYALLTTKRGLVRSVLDCQTGENIQARLSDGTLELAIKQIHKNGDMSNA